VWELSLGGVGENSEDVMRKKVRGMRYSYFFPDFGEDGKGGGRLVRKTGFM